MSNRLLSWALLSGLGLTASSALAADPNTAQQTGSVAEQRGERSGRAANDASLATDLKAKLADRVPDGAGIDVGASLGVVTLSGTVESNAAKRQAVSTAVQTSGVTGVDDQLKVRSNE